MPKPSETTARLLPTLSAIVVNYHSLDDVRRLARELMADPRASDGQFELIVVDNHSIDPADGDDPIGVPGVRLIRRPRNDGFAAAVNDGRALARGRWILLLNPDVIAGPTWPTKALDRVSAYETRPGGPPGVVGFALRNPGGTVQPSVGRFPSLTGCVREALLPRARRKYQPDRGIRPGPVPWVTGACMLIRADLLRRLGGLDAEFFLYHEEVALCRRAWDNGETVEFDPTLSVVHLRPLQNRDVSPLLRVITRHSKLLYFRKHLPSWQFEGLARIIAVESLARRTLAALVGDQPERRAWLAVAALPAMVRASPPLKGHAVRELAERVIGLDPVAASE